MKEAFSKIWTPVTAKETETGVETSVWGRTYTAGETSFLQSIISQNTELLASPIRLCGIENGKEIVWGEATHRVLPESDEVTHICSSYQSDAFILNVTNTVEFDGFMDVGITIVPRGLPVEKIGGFGTEDRNYVLEKLWLEIPLKPEIATMYQVFRRNDIVMDGKLHAGWEDYQKRGYIPESMSMGHKGELSIGNDDVGISIMSESAEGWQFAEEYKAIEIVRENGEVVIRYHLLDSEPEKWIQKGRDNGIDMSPITFRLFFQVMPIKAFPENPYKERGVHIDCYKKIPQDYEDYLASEHEDSGEIYFDRIKRLGVNTLYLHEKWNDMQNSFILTQKTRDRITYIVKECHSRGMKVIPYFGFEISTLSPYWKEMGEEVMRIEDHEREARMWYRKPYQRDPQVCYASRWGEMWLDGLTKLMDEFGFDGVYLDSTLVPQPCRNEKHGCGWRDKNGVLHPTIPFRAIRKMMKGLYEAVENRGGIINAHIGFHFSSSGGFAHSLWSGEEAQWKLMKGLVSELPEAYFRCQFAPRKFGTNIQALCYAKEPNWTYSQGMTLPLLYGVLPKPNDAGKPLEFMNEIWNIVDEYDVTGAEWYPYFKESDAKSSDDRIKVSFYEKNENGKTKRLVFMVNTQIAPVSGVNLEIGKSDFEIIKGMNAENFSVSKNNVSFDIDGFCGAVFITESK